MRVVFVLLCVAQAAIPPQFALPRSDFDRMVQARLAHADALHQERERVERMLDDVLATVRARRDVAELCDRLSWLDAANVSGAWIMVIPSNGAGEGARLCRQ